MHVTIKGCSTVDPAPALPKAAAAGLSFLGPGNRKGIDGDGGGTNVPFSPRLGSLQAVATFTVPATYTGTDESGHYPTLKTKPGHGYEFSTDPAGLCTVHFTVAASRP